MSRGALTPVPQHRAILTDQAGDIAVRQPGVPWISAARLGRAVLDIWNTQSPGPPSRIAGPGRSGSAAMLTSARPW